MVRVFIVRRILLQINSGKTGEDERAGIGAEFALVVNRNFANVGERLRKRFHGVDQIVASAELKFLDRALAIVENNAAEMIFHFGGMLLHVRERTEQALLFSGEKYEANGTARTLATFHNGLGGGENAVVPVPLSVAPSLKSQESRCAPTTTISSGCSVPTISPTTFADSTGPPVKVFCTLMRRRTVFPAARKRSS